MKRKEGFLIALLLLAASGLAQTTDSQATNDFPEHNLPKRVALARSAYTQTEEVSAGGNLNALDPKGNGTLAQLPRRMPGPMARPPLRRVAYPSMWMSHGSGRHAVIGALIGLGVGVAVCAKGNAGVRASLAIGTLGAGIGAAMGFSIPSFPDRNMYRRDWPDDDEEARRYDFHRADPRKSASTRQDSVRRTAAAQPTPPQTLTRAQESMRPAVEVP